MRAQSILTSPSLGNTIGVFPFFCSANIAKVEVALLGNNDVLCIFSSLILVSHYRFDPVPVVVNKCTAKRCKVIFVVLAVALRTLFLVNGII